MVLYHNGSKETRMFVSACRAEKERGQRLCLQSSEGEGAAKGKQAEAVTRTQK